MLSLGVHQHAIALVLTLQAPGGLFWGEGPPPPDPPQPLGAAKEEYIGAEFLREGLTAIVSVKLSDPENRSAPGRPLCLVATHTWRQTWLNDSLFSFVLNLCVIY